MLQLCIGEVAEHRGIGGLLHCQRVVRAVPAFYLRRVAASAGLRADKSRGLISTRRQRQHGYDCQGGSPRGGQKVFARRSQRLLSKVPSIRSNCTLGAEVDRTKAISSRQGSTTRSSPLMKATTIPISVLPFRTMIPPANSSVKTPSDCNPLTRNFSPNLSLNTLRRTL